MLKREYNLTQVVKAINNKEAIAIYNEIEYHNAEYENKMISLYNEGFLIVSIPLEKFNLIEIKFWDEDFRENIYAGTLDEAIQYKMDGSIR